MIEAVIFDMDGLMIDSEPIQARAFAEMILQLGAQPQVDPFKLLHQVGVNEKDNLITMKNRYQLPGTVEELSAQRKPIYEKLLLSKLAPMPGLLPLIQALKEKKLKLAVASGSRMEIIEKVLEHLGIRADFDVVVSGTEVAQGKPHPDIFLLTAKKLNVAPSACLVLEDSKNGVNSANAAGMKVIAVPNQYTKNHDFSRANDLILSLDHFDSVLLIKKVPIETKWCVITGAPCSGKTTVLRELSKQGYPFVPEVARIYIDRKLASGETLEQIRSDEGKFQRGLVSTKMEIEENLPKDSVIFMDRAMPDSITYFRVGGLDPAELREACKKYRYQKVLILDSLPFLQDHARTETLETIQFLDRQLEADYRSLGYDVLRVPVMPIENRVQFIITTLKLNSKTPFRKSIPLDSFFETGKPIGDIQSLFL